MNQSKDNDKIRYVDFQQNSSSSGGGGMDQRLTSLETKVSFVQSDIKEMKNEIKEQRNTLTTVDKNIAIILERLDSMKESLEKKPSTDAVDKKISDAKVSQIIWTIGSVLAIISITSGIIIKVLHT